jgi:hypothetical protein
MTVLVAPFASVYDDRSRLGSSWHAGGAASRPTTTTWDFFQSPKAAAAITVTRPWVAERST